MRRRDERSAQQLRTWRYACASGYPFSDARRYWTGGWRRDSDVTFVYPLDLGDQVSGVLNEACLQQGGISGAGKPLFGELAPASQRRTDLTGCHLLMLYRGYRVEHPCGDAMHAVRVWIVGYAQRTRDPDIDGPPTRH